MDKRPAYVIVYETLKKEIKNENIRVGEKLQPEPELEKRFSVSRTTIRRAVELLVQEGFVSVKQGKGTVVLDSTTRQTLNGITSVSETLKKKGIAVRPQKVDIQIVPVKEHIARELQIDVGEKVARIHRVQLADDVPLAIIKNYIPYYKVPGIEQYADDIYSLYEFLESRYNIAIEKVEDRISAQNADKEQAELLKVKEGKALLYMRRICYAREIPVCVDRLGIISEKYELEITMLGRKK